MELASLLDEARSASPRRRIEFRDRIAAHGTRAIEGVAPWLADDVLAAFAVRVIERVGATGEAQAANRVLRAARPRVPSNARADVDWALQRIREANRPAAPDVPQAPAPARPVVRARRRSR